MRIVAGAWRGRALVAPAGEGTRPTADRVRQALFDMLMHAEWGGRACVEGARVLDVFAGTGALGLEALSRGAAHATFIEQDRAALAVLRANIATCRAGDRCTVLPVNALAAPAAPQACSLVFLDPPYRAGLLASAVAHLRGAGWIAPGAIIVTETARGPSPQPPPARGGEAMPHSPSPRGRGQGEGEHQIGKLLAERTHGPARITVWRSG